MKFEIRDDGSAVISGYVNAVGRESRVLRDISGEFVEVVQPGCFESALKNNDSVELRFNHARGVDEYELELREDAIGLKADAVIRDSEVIEHAKNGDLTGWSFGFFMKDDSWSTRDDGMRVRTLEDIDLIEVSILTKTPAYIATSIEMRGEEQAVKEFRVLESEVEVINNQTEEPEPVEVQAVEPSVDMTHLRQEFEFIRLRRKQ